MHAAKGLTALELKVTYAGPVSARNEAAIIVNMCFG